MKDGMLIVVTLLCFVGCSCVVGAAEDKGPVHRVVFEFVSADPKLGESLLNNVENVQKALGPGLEVAVVVHGEGLALLKAGTNPLAQRLGKISQPHVQFLACENTMRRKSVRKEDLLPFVATVDSGVAEVVRRQGKGWSYIKSGG